MRRFSFFLAQIDVKDNLTADLQKTGIARGGLTMLFAAFGIVTVLIVAWALFIRKKPDESSRRYSYPSRYSRRRRKRRSRNPTLAETGGLPPIRPEGYFEDPP